MLEADVKYLTVGAHPIDGVRKGLKTLRSRRFLQGVGGQRRPQRRDFPQGLSKTFRSTPHTPLSLPATSHLFSPPLLSPVRTTNPKSRRGRRGETERERNNGLLRSPSAFSVTGLYHWAYAGKCLRTTGQQLQSSLFYGQVGPNVFHFSWTALK